MSSTEYKISEPTKLVLDAIKATEEMTQAVAEYYATTTTGDKVDVLFDEFTEKYHSPLIEFLEEQLLESMRNNRTFMDDNGVVI